MKKIAGQGIFFVGLSGIGWILDFCVYIGFEFILLSPVIRNIVSSWVGVTFVFIFATRKIFQNNSNIPLRWKYLIYLVYQVILIYFISVFLGMVDNFISSTVNVVWIQDFSPFLAKVFVTPITMCLNFFMMKRIIERL